jgi:hypothetical protein
MGVVADVDKPVIASPAVRHDDALERRLSPDKSNRPA